MTKKIGIMTFSKALNYGAFWQTLALQEALINCGYEVKIINYKGPYNIWSEFKHFCLSKKTALKVSGLRRYLEFKKDQKYLRLTKRFWHNKSIKYNNFDSVVFGSDSIWGISDQMIRNFDPYFGVDCTCKKISYAVSIGQDSANFWSPSTAQQQSLTSFSHVGVRDANTEQALEKISTPNLVLDPTLLYSFEDILSSTQRNLKDIY